MLDRNQDSNGCGFGSGLHMWQASIHHPVFPFLFTSPVWSWTTILQKKNFSRIYCKQTFEKDKQNATKVERSSIKNIDKRFWLGLQWSTVEKRRSLLKVHSAAMNFLHAESEMLKWTLYSRTQIICCPKFRLHTHWYILYVSMQFCMTFCLVRVADMFKKNLIMTLCDC